MVKGESVVLRISAEDKKAIKAAAERGGKSLTTFITEAAMKQAREVERRPPAKGIHGGVPTFFRACCMTAASGGESGYASPGWHLASAVGSQIPYDLDLDEWEQEVDALKELLADGDDEGAWDWFKRHYPKCMALVPTRRRDQFVQGVRRAYDEDRIEV
jgi:hypothetical protein